MVPLHSRRPLVLRLLPLYAVFSDWFIVRCISSDDEGYRGPIESFTIEIVRRLMRVRKTCFVLGLHLDFLEAEADGRTRNKMIVFAIQPAKPPSEIQKRAL